MNCDTCAHWIQARVTHYEDGSTVENARAPAGKGLCGVLDIDTAANFGCNSHVEGSEHVVTSEKTGAPWQHWVMVDCPVCVANGQAPAGARCQCAGTQKVRLYDDGFVGDEKTRIHPKERELGLMPQPKCGSCAKEINSGWKVCPHCGNRLDPVADVEQVVDPLFSPQA